MIMGKSDGNSGETLSPRKKKNVTRRELSETLAQASVLEESLPSPSALLRDVSEKRR